MHLAPCCFVFCCFLLRIVKIIFVIGGKRRWAYASLAACHCMLFYVPCMFIDTWQKILSLSLSLSLCTIGRLTRQFPLHTASRRPYSSGSPCTILLRR